MNQKNQVIIWKIIAFIAIFATVAISAVFALTIIESDEKTPNETRSIDETNEPTSSEKPLSSIDNLMANFSGTDEEVIQICETELYALGIDDYVSIDEPLEGPFIQETRVGTYELNGILRTPSNSPDMPQPKSTEMLCTIFPGDEYPVEITFGKDW